MSRELSDKPDKGNAYNKALALLARREHSGRELKSKLEQRGFDRVESTAALERLQGQSYQSDQRFGENLVRTRIAQGYGPRWISAELKTHGIAESTAAALIAVAEPDWIELASQQLRRRYGAKAPSNLAERTKRGQFLLRRGFEVATVRTVTRAEGFDNTDWTD